MSFVAYILTRRAQTHTHTNTYIYMASYLLKFFHSFALLPTFGEMLCPPPTAHPRTGIDELLFPQGEMGSPFLSIEELPRTNTQPQPPSPVFPASASSPHSPGYILQRCCGDSGEVMLVGEVTASRIYHRRLWEENPAQTQLSTEVFASA